MCFNVTLLYWDTISYKDRATPQHFVDVAMVQKGSTKTKHAQKIFLYISKGFLTIYTHVNPAIEEIIFLKGTRTY